MGTSERRQLPPDLVRGLSRFQTWRERRKACGRIRQSLWARAVRLANVHGISRTAAVLGLDYHSLQERAETAAQPQSSGPAFVECLSSVMVGKQCQFELDNDRTGFIAQTPIQSLRDHLRRTATR